MMLAQVNGMTLAFNDQGNGFPLVFLHAFPLNRSMWTEQENALSSQFRVMTIDLRGHGESDAPLWHYTLDQAADDVCGLLDHLSIKQAVFVGLSMGGYILFAFYRKYAERHGFSRHKSSGRYRGWKTGTIRDGSDCLQTRVERDCGHHDPEIIESWNDPDEAGVGSTGTRNDRGQPSQWHCRRSHGDGTTT
jgi:hypothetical protein